MIEHKVVRCPHCGTTDNILFVEILRTKSIYPVIDIEVDTELDPDAGGFSTLRLDAKCGEDTIDSAGNETRLECSCGWRWIPDVDEHKYKDDALTQAYLLQTDAEKGISYCKDRNDLLADIESVLLAYEENGERPEDAIKDMSVALLEFNLGVLEPATRHISIEHDHHGWSVELLAPGGEQ